jgi:DNA-binding transcriptional MerR regulator
MAKSMAKEGAFIGDVSRRTGLSVHTIRFYQAEGLVREPARTDSGYRVFSPQTVEQLQFIRKAQALGFTLDEIRELLVLRDRSTDACAHVKSLVEEKIASVHGKIRELEAMEKDLKRVLADCNRQVRRHTPAGRGPCPVLMKLGRKKQNRPQMTPSGGVE